MRDKWQFTPLHSAANGGHVSTIRKLIQFSHEVDAKDYLGERSVLHARTASAQLVSTCRECSKDSQTVKAFSNVAPERASSGPSMMGGCQEVVGGT